MIRDSGAGVFVDGAKAFGAVAANYSLDLAMERAARFGVGAVSARRCCHFGAAAHYVLRAARGGFVALAACNTPAVMAPYGGSAAVVGNNPLAIAAPVREESSPFVLDIAQSVVARGRIKLAEMQRRAIPEGWAIGPDGRPTSDPTAALAGALLAFGGYKGYGLALAVEVLTSVLAGADLSPELLNTSMTGAPTRQTPGVLGHVGQLFLALDPRAFVGAAEFEAGIVRFLDAVKAIEPAPGFEEVLLPGELEQRSTQTAARFGVPLADASVELLTQLADELSIAPLVPLSAVND